MTYIQPLNHSTQPNAPFLLLLLFSFFFFRCSISFFFSSSEEDVESSIYIQLLLANFNAEIGNGKQVTSLLGNSPSLSLSLSLSEFCTILVLADTGKPEVSHVCGHYPPRPTYPNASNSKASFFLCFSLNFFFSFLSFSDIFLFSSFPLKFEFLCFLLLRPFPHA